MPCSEKDETNEETLASAKIRLNESPWEGDPATQRNCVHHLNEVERGSDIQHESQPAEHRIDVQDRPVRKPTPARERRSHRGKRFAKVRIQIEQTYQSTVSTGQKLIAGKARSQAQNGSERKEGGKQTVRGTTPSMKTQEARSECENRARTKSRTIGPKPLLP